MTPRTVSVLLLVAIVSIAAAGYAVSTRVSYQNTNFEGQRLFAGLLENAKDVREIVVTQGGKTLTFGLEGDAWVLRNSGGYKVHNNLVSKVIFGLSNMELLDAKTNRKSRFEALQLGDPQTKDSKSQQVVLKDASGKEMAALIVGRANFFLPETTTGGMYVRRPGEDQTWLVRGLVDIGVEPRDWLIREIIDIKPEQILRADVRHPDGEELHVIPKEGVTGSFAFEDMPEGFKLESEFAPRNIAAVLSGFVLNDVRKAENVSLDPADAYVSTYKVKDGITVTLHMWSKDDKQYMTLAADYEGSAEVSEAAKLVADINARTNGWVYIIPEYQFEQISKKMADVIKKIEPDS